MKRLLSISILILTLFISQTLIAQKTQFNLDRNIQLKNQDSNEKNIKINVASNTSSLNLLIASFVYLGNVTIEIFDPNGLKKGNFSVESQVEETIPISGEPNETVQGQINQRIESPIKGTWIVKIRPTKAVGTVNIQTQHSINSNKN